MSPLLVQTRVLRYSLGLRPLLMFQGLVSSIKETILTDYNPGNLIGDKYEGATNGPSQNGCSRQDIRDSGAAIDVDEVGRCVLEAIEGWKSN